MRRLLLVVALCLPVLVASVLLARRAGLEQTAAIDLLFQDETGQACAGLCLLGVEPGKTPFAEAVERVRKHPVGLQAITERGTGDLFELLSPNSVISLVRDPRGGTASINIRFEGELTLVMPRGFQPALPVVRNVLPLGSAILKFGAPSRVQLTQRGTHLMRLYYPKSGVLLTSLATHTDESRYIDIYDELQYVSLSTPDWYREVWPMSMFISATWSGFGAANRYTSAVR